MRVAHGPHIHQLCLSPVNEGPLINGFVLGSFNFTSSRCVCAGSIHDSDDAIKAVHDLHVVNNKKVRAPSRWSPKWATAHRTSPMMTVDSPATFIPTNATRLTCDTGSRPRSWACPSRNTGSPRTSCAGRPCCGSSRPRGDQAPRRRILSSRCSARSTPCSPGT